MVLRRFTHKIKLGRPKVLSSNSPAIVNKSTVYPAMRRRPEFLKRLLKSGHNNRKIGKVVTKGKWKGFPIFMLTLEERATCPTYCATWKDCYGNKMHWSQRIIHGRSLEQRLQKELSKLQSHYPKGFVVRLHVLGDFYSIAYIVAWRQFLKDFPALHVWGYTARDRRNDPLGIMLEGLRRHMPNRFVMRFSHQPGKWSTQVVDFPEEATSDAIVCPVQTDQTDCCATCGLCWATNRPIAFLRH